MNGNALGQPTILQPGQMPMQGQNFQYSFPHADGSPVMTPGMVPGVPGSMGLNPGMGGPIHGQQSSAGGPVMTPGGNGTGTPLQGGMGQQFGGLQAQFAREHQGGGLGQLFQSPQFQALLQNPEMQAFLQGHPRFQRFMPQGNPQTAPNALSPPMMPPTSAPPGMMQANTAPGMSASTNPNQYGLPTYGG